MSTKNNRRGKRTNYYVDDCGYIVNPDDYHDRLSLIDKKRFLSRPELHRGWRISAQEIAEAKAWVKSHEELEEAYKGPRPSLAEQNAMLEEMGLVCGVYAKDEPVAPYPSEACEDAGQPAGLSADQVIAEFERAYQYGRSGVFLNSPGAYLRFRRQEAEADAYRRQVWIRQEAYCKARDRAAAAA
jgi:hypothetical protein